MLAKHRNVRTREVNKWKEMYKMNKINNNKINNNKINNINNINNKYK